MPEQQTNVIDISFNYVKVTCVDTGFEKIKKSISQDKLRDHIIPDIKNSFSSKHPARIHISEICSNVLEVLIFASLIERFSAVWYVTGLDDKFIKVC